MRISQGSGVDTVLFLTCCCCCCCRRRYDCYYYHDTRRVSLSCFLHYGVRGERYGRIKRDFLFLKRYCEFLYRFPYILIIVLPYLVSICLASPLLACRVLVGGLFLIHPFFVASKFRKCSTSLSSLGNYVFVLLRLLTEISLSFPAPTWYKRA